MKTKVRSSLLIVDDILLMYLALCGAFQALAIRYLRHWFTGIGEVLAIVPAVLILIGLFDAWVPKELVERGLGPKSGLQLILFALLL